MSADSVTPKKPTLAITMGDPTGVGPEIIADVWSNPLVHEICRPVVLGDPEIMRRAVQLKGQDAEVRAIANFAEGPALTSPELMPCLACGKEDLSQMVPGVVTAESGQAAYEAIVTATKLTLAGECDGIVTAPISKAGLHAAGQPYPGHTELLADLCDVEEFAMMLYLPPRLAPKTRCGLGVVHVTLHTSVRNAIDALTPETVLEKCRLADSAAKAYGATNPRIGVAALNPHGGEGGLFGDEEARVIEPGVRRAQAEGIDATGPLPADTLMVRAADGEFDIVVAMLHDQGHIALKLMGMHGAVNVTLGLPIVRTSVAHGTAPDVAWKGIAETSGMIAAMEAAVALIVHRGSA